MDFSEYINPELLTAVPVLNAVGYWLKSKTKMNNKYIPIVLGAVGVVLSGLYSFCTCDLQCVSKCIATSIVQGILLAASAVYANQVYKQMK